MPDDGSLSTVLYSSPMRYIPSLTEAMDKKTTTTMLTANASATSTMSAMRTALAMAGSRRPYAISSFLDSFFSDLAVDFADFAFSFPINSPV